jgi:hypothetical protein
MAYLRKSQVTGLSTRSIDLNTITTPAGARINGDITSHTLKMADTFTVVSDITISDNLILAKLSDDGDDLILTSDNVSDRTIEGSGSIEVSTIAQAATRTSLTGMTGTVGSAVTGSPALNLGNTTGTLGSGVTGGSGLNAVSPANLASGVLSVGVTGGSGLTALGTVTVGDISHADIVYPAGHIVQTKLNSRSSKVTFGSSSWATAGVPVTITPAYSNSKMLIQLYGKTDMNNSFEGATPGSTAPAGQDYKITRVNGPTENWDWPANTVYQTSWTHYLNPSDYTADFYPPLILTWIDTGSFLTDPEVDLEITYGMFGRKYSGSSYPDTGAAWGFADNNYQSGYGTYWGCMIVQEIKQ